MVNITELSRLLGLSITQVSRALNGYPDVSDSTRKRVEDAARQLGYRANPTAQRLRTGRSGIIGLVLPEKSEQEESNILVEILTGLATAFWRRDILVVLNVMPAGGTSVQSYSRLSGEGTLDGFVVINPGIDHAGIAFLLENGLPFVTHGRESEMPDHAFVDLDNRAVGARLGGQLAALGHREIALIDGQEDLFFARERRRGVEDTLADAGLGLRRRNCRHGIMTEHFGEMSARQLMADRAQAPTAIVAGNMVVATGVLRALDDLRLSVPADVSVVAHDDVLTRYPSQAFATPLSGTRSPFADAWDAIADNLVRMIGGENDPPPRTVMAPDPVAGGSAAPPSR